MVRVRTVNATGIHHLKRGVEHLQALKQIGAVDLHHFLAGHLHRCSSEAVLRLGVISRDDSLAYLAKQHYVILLYGAVIFCHSGLFLGCLLCFALRKHHGVCRHQRQYDQYSRFHRLIRLLR